MGMIIRLFFIAYLLGVCSAPRARAEDEQSAQQADSRYEQVSNDLWAHLSQNKKQEDLDKQALIDRILQGLRESEIEGLEGLQKDLEDMIKDIGKAKPGDGTLRAKSNSLAMLLHLLGRGDKKLPRWVPQETDDQARENLKGEYGKWKEKSAGQDKSFKAFLEYLSDEKEGNARIQPIFSSKIGANIPQPSGSMEGALPEGGPGSSPRQGRHTSAEFTAEDLYPSNAQTQSGNASIRTVRVKEGDWHGAKVGEGLSVVLSPEKDDRHGMTLSLDPHGQDFQHMLQGKDFLRDDRPEFQNHHAGTFFVQLKPAHGGDYELWFGDTRDSARRIGTLNELRVAEVRKAQEYGLVSQINGRKYYVFGQGHSSEGQLVYYDKEKIDAMGSDLKAVEPDHVAVVVRHTHQIQSTAHIGEVDGQWLVLPFDYAAKRYGEAVAGEPPPQKKRHEAKGSGGVDQHGRPLLSGGWPDLGHTPLSDGKIYRDSPLNAEIAEALQDHLHIYETDKGNVIMMFNKDMRSLKGLPVLGLGRTLRRMLPGGEVLAAEDRFGNVSYIQLARLAEAARKSEAGDYDPPSKDLSAPYFAGTLDVALDKGLVKFDNIKDPAALKDAAQRAGWHGETLERALDKMRDLSGHFSKPISGTAAFIASGGKSVGKDGSVIDAPETDDSSPKGGKKDEGGKGGKDSQQYALDNRPTGLSPFVPAGSPQVGFPKKFKHALPSDNKKELELVQKEDSRAEDAALYTAAGGKSFIRYNLIRKQGEEVSKMAVVEDVTPWIRPAVEKKVEVRVSGLDLGTTPATEGPPESRLHLQYKVWRNDDPSDPQGVVAVFNSDSMKYVSYVAYWGMDAGQAAKHARPGARVE